MPSTLNPIKEKLHEIIFEADTPLGRIFDIALLITIVASVIIVMLESVNSYSTRFHNIFIILEWIFTIIFTIEYALRIYCVYKPIKYVTSFFGIIDLLAIIPTYLSFLIIGTHYLLVIRALRLIRVFRIFKLAKYVNESAIIVIALRNSKRKIMVFLFFIFLLVIIFGSIMYLVEGTSNTDFDSIPRSIYWAVVTLTTVGYGDISPVTPFGQFLSAIVMILGYSVIAVPTGIVSAEMVKSPVSVNTRSCRYCSQDGHDDDAEYCKYCGELLDEELA